MSLRMCSRRNLLARHVLFRFALYSCGHLKVFRADIKRFKRTRDRLSRDNASVISTFPFVCNKRHRSQEPFLRDVNFLVKIHCDVYILQQFLSPGNCNKVRVYAFGKNKQNRRTEYFTDYYGRENKRVIEWCILNKRVYDFSLHLVLFKYQYFVFILRWIGEI